MKYDDDDFVDINFFSKEDTDALKDDTKDETKDETKDNRIETEVKSVRTSMGIPYFLLSVAHFLLCTFNAFLLINHTAENLLYDVIIFVLVLTAFTMSSKKRVIETEKQRLTGLGITLHLTEFVFTVMVLLHIITTFT